MMETGIYEKRVRFTGYYFRTGAFSVHGGRKSYSTVCFNLSRGEVTHFYFIIMANKFKDDVVFTMLEIIREMNCLKMIDGRRIKNSDVYAKIAGKLNNHYGWEGDNTVNGMQINTKWGGRVARRETTSGARARRTTLGSILRCAARFARRDPRSPC